MLATGSWPLLRLLLSLLSCFLNGDFSLAFSLKNCVILYSEKANNVSVTCAERSLTAFPDDIPRNAISLDLNLNSISNITRTDLRGLSTLETLHADYNLISHIDDGAFSDLVELRVLILDENILTNLTDNMFQGLSKLETLSLDNNQISSISPLAFQPLKSIRSVHLDSNRLHQVADIEIIIKLPTLQHLFIWHNNFSSFQSDDLHVNATNLLTLSFGPMRKFSITRDIFPHLQSLDLRGCSSNIEWDVSNKTFMRSLTRLDLDETEISFETYRRMLQTTESLQNLQLGYMKKWIEDGLVDITCQIPSLRTLGVHHNEIYTINDNLLQSCSQLTELSLYYNGLEKITDNALESMTQLTYLDLQENKLSELPVAVQRLTTLRILDLSCNKIENLYCSDFSNLTKLTILNLSCNPIAFIFDYDFQNLNDLKVLNLENNDILLLTNLFKDKLQKLEFLNMRNNDLQMLLQEDFRNMSSLRYLDIKLTECVIVDELAFEGLDNLQTLHLFGDNYLYMHLRGLQNLETLILYLSFSRTHDRIEQVDDPFSNLPNLKKLVIKDERGYHDDISPNVLSGLRSLEFLMTERFFMGSLHPDTFKCTPRLKVLKIVNSELSDLTSEVFWSIPNLEMLDLSNNKLISLEFLAKANLLVLRWLNLRGNELLLISETVFQSLPALTYLDLSANPLTCECFNAEFNKWIQSNNQTQVVNAHQYICPYPASQRGNRFLDFDINSCWVDTSFLCFLSSSCVIVLTLLTSFIYHFLRWQLTYAYHLFLAFLYDNQKRKKGTAYNYDAFVSYNVHDEAWVYGDLLPVLEDQQGWRLCLHHRDFEPGKPIVENITEAIYSSRKTICVISQNYLQSEWCSREIQMASFRLFDEHKDVLIMVFLEEIPAKQLSPYYRMRSLVKKRTYLSWPQAGQHTGVFWQKIRQALERAENPTEHTDLLTGHPTIVQ